MVRATCLAGLQGALVARERGTVFEPEAPHIVEIQLIVRAQCEGLLRFNAEYRAILQVGRHETDGQFTVE